MPVNDELGKRMKEYYEQIPKTKLMRRTPVALRLDGKAFHTFTRGFQKPFDYVLIHAMQKTMKYLCENIQGCVFGYTQSDEITLILQDYKKFSTAAWFDYEVQKICSIAASMCTMIFNKEFGRLVQQEIFEARGSLAPQSVVLQEKIEKYHQALLSAQEKGAMFDCRVFNIPKEEVVNLVYWRQTDATRNSIQMVGQAYFSPKQLHKKTCGQIQEMLFQQEGINWDKYPTFLKRGAACVYKNSKWEVDLEMPTLVGEDRGYLQNILDAIQEEG